MKAQQFISGIILGIVLTATVAATIQQPPQNPVKWEYKQECNPKEMDKRGAEGWELVTVTAPNSLTLCLFYKRPKQ